MLKFFGRKLKTLFQGKVDENTLEELEQLFYEADLGSELSESLTKEVRKIATGASSTDQILDHIKQVMTKELSQASSEMSLENPTVILIVGVNGNGKTTTVAKLANHFQKEGRSVLIGAADTFRAAATEQLELWAERLGCEIVKGKLGSDPAAVVFDALQAAKARQKEIVIIDTAGRLHTKLDLMQELEKIRRVADKAAPGAPHETLLVLDATVGQNALAQAKIFHEYTPLSGVVLTKLDGTAKGGSVIHIQKELKLPIKYIGIGEQIDDLECFDPASFVSKLLEL